MTTKWILRTEDIDRYEINVIGVFADREGAVGYARNLIEDTLKEDEDGFDEWLSENNYDEQQHPMDEYVDETMKVVDDTVARWRKANDSEPPKDRNALKRWARESRGFEWGDSVYIITKVPDFS